MEPELCAGRQALARTGQRVRGLLDFDASDQVRPGDVTGPLLEANTQIEVDREGDKVRARLESKAMATRVRSYSKINLGLAIGPVRADGFHGLTTLYQTLDLHDLVTVSARRAAKTRLVLTTNHARVPTDGRNTAWKMVERCLERLGVTAEVEISIEKSLPVQGGMGAGSANAAAALIGLERELGVALPGAARLELAAEVGSDVPLFLLGGAVLGLGRGEQVVPLPDLPRTACVVAVPNVGVSTPQAFREWDENRDQGSGVRDQ